LQVHCCCNYFPGCYLRYWWCWR